MKDLVFFAVVLLVLIYLFAQPDQQAEVNKHMKAIHEVIKQILPVLGK